VDARFTVKAVIIKCNSVSTVKVKFYLSLTKHHNLKMYLEVEVLVNEFLTSTMHGGEWSASHPGRFTPGERVPCTDWIGGWVSPTAGLAFFPSHLHIQTIEMSLT
jgi:hypothetical protein